MRTAVGDAGEGVFIAEQVGEGLGVAVGRTGEPRGGQLVGDGDVEHGVDGVHTELGGDVPKLHLGEALVLGT